MCDEGEALKAMRYVDNHAHPNELYSNNLNGLAVGLMADDRFAAMVLHLERMFHNARKWLG